MAKPSNEAKLPVIIALVFFIIATLGVGIFAYTLSQDVAKATEDKKGSDDKAAAATKDLQKIKDEIALLRVASGTATADDTARIQSGITDKEGFREKHKALMQAINGAAASARDNEQKRNTIGVDLTGAVVMDWTWPANQQDPPLPKENLISASIRNVAQRELARKRSEVEVKALEDAKKSIQDAMAQFNAATKTLNDLNAKYPEEVKAEVNKAIATFDKFKQDFTAESGKYRTEKNAMDVEKIGLELAQKRTLTDLERFKEGNKRLLDALNTDIDPFQYDKPKGKVLRRYSENLVDVDLGSADNLRVGQTFSIFPSDTPSRGMQARMRRVLDADGKYYTRPVPKGTIEVVDVLGSNLAQCRITTEDSQIRDRLLSGDLLYNAIWNKGASEHVVLFGIFDIDGDGRDDIKTVVENLTKVGVAVDGYYDLGTMKWVGEIKSQTTFAVEGYYPSVSIADGNRDGKIKILSALSDAKKLSMEKGLRILRPRDFFPRIGYNAKLDISEAAINSSATYYLRGGVATEAAPATPGGAAEPAKKDN